MLNKLLNMLTLKAKASRTVENDPLQKFMFRVTIPGLPSGVSFQKVGGLSRETAVVEYLEGMYQYAHKLAGREKVSDITLERGSYASEELMKEYKKVLTNPARRSTIIIEILDRFGNTRRTYKLAEAWVTKWEGSDLDATSDDVAIEKITVTFEYFIED